MKTLTAALLCLCVARHCPWTSAAEFKTAPIILMPKGESSDEDLLAAAFKVRIQTKINGDLAAAAFQTVQVFAPVEGYAFLAGQILDLNDTVGNDAWLIGKYVSVRSRIADNAYAVGVSVTLNEKSLIGRDAFIAGGTVNLNGKVGRDVRIAARMLIIDGTVGGTLYAKASQVRLLDHAVIKGDLYYESPNSLWQSPKAKVQGRIVHRLPPEEKSRPVFWSRLSGWLRRLAAAIIFGTVLLTTAPKPVIQAAKTVARSFWISLGIGLVATIVVPIGSVIALITIIGIPLGLASLAVYAVLLYASGLFVALALGKCLAQRFRARISGVALLACGAVIFALLYELPLFGWIAKLVVTIVGFGAFCLTLWEAHCTLKRIDQPPLLS